MPPTPPGGENRKQKRAGALRNGLWGGRARVRDSFSVLPSGGVSGGRNRIDRAREGLRRLAGRWPCRTGARKCRAAANAARASSRRRPSFAASSLPRRTPSASCGSSSSSAGRLGSQNRQRMQRGGLFTHGRDPLRRRLSALLRPLPAGRLRGPPRQGPRPVERLLLHGPSASRSTASSLASHSAAVSPSCRSQSTSATMPPAFRWPQVGGPHGGALPRITGGAVAKARGRSGAAGSAGGRAWCSSSPRVPHVRAGVIPPGSSGPRARRRRRGRTSRRSSLLRSCTRRGGSARHRHSTCRLSTGRSPSTP